MNNLLTLLVDFHYFYLFTMSLFFGYQLRFSFSFRIIFWLVRWVLVVFACIWGTYYLSLFNHNAFKFRHSYKDQFEMIEDPLFWNQVVFYAFHPILLLTHLITLWSIHLSLDYISMKVLTIYYIIIWYWIIQIT